MRQSRIMSLIEAATNVVVGYVLARGYLLRRLFEFWR